MSYPKKRNTPPPVDPEAAAKEAERQEFHASNAPLQAGLAAAMKTERDNRIRELHGEIANLQRMKTSRGSIAAARAGYDRVYARLERIARVVVDLTGQPVQIPAYDPPMDLTSNVQTVSVGLPSAAPYIERGGKGPSGKGLPTARPVPGSAQATDSGDWPK